jgi:hypothetical protein
MLLWKDTFGNSDLSSEAREADHDCPWKHWPRPPAGFLDFGSVKLYSIIVDDTYPRLDTLHLVAAMDCSPIFLSLRDMTGKESIFVLVLPGHTILSLRRIIFTSTRLTPLVLCTHPAPS